MQAENARLRGQVHRLSAALEAIGGKHHPVGDDPVSQEARRIGPLSGRVAFCTNRGCRNHARPIPIKHGRTFICAICGTESGVLKVSA